MKIKGGKQIKGCTKNYEYLFCTLVPSQYSGNWTTSSADNRVCKIIRQKIVMGAQRSLCCYRYGNNTIIAA